MAANYRTDRTLPWPDMAAPSTPGLDTGTLLAGDRVKIVSPLQDIKAGHKGATGTVVWTDGGYRPVVQLGDGTVLNLIENDSLAPATVKGRGQVPLLTLRHNTATWKPGFESDLYLQIPAATGLETAIKPLVEAHNKTMRGDGRDFKISVENGVWDGPDLKPAAAKKIVAEALADWAGL
ncbi:MAG TPA: hypothetical protein VF867_14145 [Arthrobacter sp.]